jgi:cell division transport system permease protein
MAHTTVMIGTGVLVLVFSAMVLTVVFATRGALSGNRHIVEVLHFVGAESSLRRQRIPEALPEDQPQGRRGRWACWPRLLPCRKLLAERIAGHPADRPGNSHVRHFLGRLHRLCSASLRHDRHLRLLTTLTARLTVMRTIYEIDLSAPIPRAPTGLSIEHDCVFASRLFAALICVYFSNHEHGPHVAQLIRRRSLGSEGNACADGL